MTLSLTDIRGEIGNLFLDAGWDGRVLPVWNWDHDPELSPQQRQWIETCHWKPGLGHMAILPGTTGVAGAVYGLGDDAAHPFAKLAAGILPLMLPEGDYEFAGTCPDPFGECLAWAMGAYNFHRYQSSDKRPPRRLKLPAAVDRERLLDTAQAIWFARDMINTPSNDMGPADVEAAVRDAAGYFGAAVTAITGDYLHESGFRLHHAVGRASDRPPRLVDLVWGDESAPKITLVGKGICFDTGGLDIKPAPGMLLMKKDMGGAASALSLAAMIMAAKLPVRLRVLIPAADNSISGNAFRPGDIIRSRAGLSVEIADTDAEGRLVLADALSLADEEAPDLLITFATLTGSARTALGPDMPPFYTQDDALAQSVAAAGAATADPLWRMPFWPPYDSYLKSDNADMANAAFNGFAGSIVAAMFLKRFVRQAARFLHLDIYAWTPRAMPGRPVGGEPHGARALFDVIAQQYRAET